MNATIGLCIVFGACVAGVAAVFVNTLLAVGVGVAAMLALAAVVDLRRRS